MKKQIAVWLAICQMLCCLTGCRIHEKVWAVQGETIELPVLMYHGLTENESRRNQYMIPPSLLEDDLRCLKANGYTTVFVSQLVEHFRNGTPLPSRPVLLTFDDGYLNNYTYAFPLLKKYQCKALISPIGLAADEAENEKYRSPEWSQCKWSELKEMVQSGLVEIGNHTYQLHKNTVQIHGAAKQTSESDEDYAKRLKEDLITANHSITSHTGTPPCAFVYPFGAKSEHTEEIVRSQGFSAILDCENKMNYLSSQEDLFHMHRFLRVDRLSADDFLKRIGVV